MAKKFLWVLSDQENPWEDRKKFITSALEAGADCVVVNSDEIKRVRELGDINVAVSVEEGVEIDSCNNYISGGAKYIIVGKNTDWTDRKIDSDDFQIKKDLKLLKKNNIPCILFLELLGKNCETFASKNSEYFDYTIVVGQDWKIIPLENLIADIGSEKIIAGVKDSEEAKTAFETLEKGVDGVLIDPSLSSAGEIRKTLRVLESLSSPKLEIVSAKVTNVKSLGTGDRVCVDTCSILELGEGMLVGSQSNGLFLIHGETLETPYVETRPFRVNAGPVHAYTLGTNGKTLYLSELKAGDEILLSDPKGQTRPAVVGRVKIERRPLILVEAEYNGKKYKTLLQNAETIRLVEKDGKAISVVKLTKGAEVLIHVEEIGRHFGTKVEETIIER